MLSENMKQQPQVSVIVPCHNYGIYLEEALESVRLQTYQQWECLVIDDGSTDDTEEIAVRFCSDDDRFRYFRQSKMGVSAARNYGLSQSVGSFVQFLDADDLLARDKLASHLLLLTSEQLDLVYGSHSYFDKAGVYPVQPIVMFSRSEILERLSVTNPFVISAPIFRVRDGLTFERTLPFCEDWVFWFDLVSRNGFKVSYVDLEEPSTLIRRHEKSATALSQKRILTYNYVAPALLSKRYKDSFIEERYLGKLQATSITNKRHLIAFLENEYFHAIRQRSFFVATKYFVQLIGLNPKPFYYLRHSLYWITRIN